MVRLMKSSGGGGSSSSSRAYNVWSEKEEVALRSGVKRYGVGAWEMIRQDKDFNMLK